MNWLQMLMQRLLGGGQQQKPVKGGAYGAVSGAPDLGDALPILQLLATLSSLPPSGGAGASPAQATPPADLDDPRNILAPGDPRRKQPTLP